VQYNHLFHYFENLNVELNQLLNTIISIYYCILYISTLFIEFFLYKLQMNPWPFSSNPLNFPNSLPNVAMGQQLQNFTMGQQLPLQLPNMFMGQLPLQMPTVSNLPMAHPMPMSSLPLNWMPSMGQNMSLVSNKFIL
jgi:hypothetical protein